MRNKKAAIPTPVEKARFEVDKYPAIDLGNMSRFGVITQEDDNVQSTPAANTQQQQREQNVMQEYAYSMINLPIAMTKSAFATAPQKKSNTQIASRQYPLAFMCKWAQAVLDNDTGDFLEYRQLIKNPKYREVWSTSFAKEIKRLADTKTTITFMDKHQIPQERRKEITYG